MCFTTFSGAIAFNNVVQPMLFFLSNIKSYRDKVLKHYDLLDYNTKTEPRGSKISDYPLGLNVNLNTTDNTKLHMNTRSHFKFDAMVI